MERRRPKSKPQVADMLRVYRLATRFGVRPRPVDVEPSRVVSLLRTCLAADTNAPSHAVRVGRTGGVTVSELIAAFAASAPRRTRARTAERLHLASLALGVLALIAAAVFAASGGR